MHEFAMHRGVQRKEKERRDGKEETDQWQWPFVLCMFERIGGGGRVSCSLCMKFT